MKYAFIQSLSTKHRIIRLCHALDVSVNGYYSWCNRPESKRSIEDRQLTAKIKLFHKASRQIYGSPRIHKDLQEMGERVGVNRVARLMRANDIASKMARKFVITTNSKNTMQPAPDLLKREFDVERPDKAWVSDTTLIPTRQGWLYLAVIIDLYSRHVIGWAMSNHNNTLLVQDALTMAIWRRGRVESVVVHSDQGSTYTSGDYQRLLKESSLRCSMSRKGECLDNAVAESFFGTLKTELVDYEDYKTKQEAKQSLFEYIEVFYNRRRRHSYLGYVSPAEYEAKCAS
ncbi:IS3 family transposase [Candidatus Reidiella endopervernicosa]|uniref:IS3 family transposase n=1 Tax=Candidatus Reidiella endopervernicosa TaxID=2738883 RepID=A0A6N0HTC7_9GAMM|nr:IS3 family transposase [Candidatus Reidiella endopervernicosa]QKQ25622.1 IS3 family transposase [Candidatus Reidiella endopervernicosa]